MSVNSENANRPATIEGMPVMTSTRKVTVRGIHCVGLRVLDQVDRGEEADRHRHQRGDPGDLEGADDRLQGAVRGA